MNKKVGIIGLGTLGREVALRLNNSGIDVITCDIDKSKKIDKIPFKQFIFPLGLIGDSSIDTIVELVGGEKAYPIIEKSLIAGKNVVTANKLVIDKYGQDLENLAIINKRYLRFEAAVAGAIPIIDALKNSLIGHRTHTIEGILNGTTNYILTKMEQGLNYNQALKEAQQKGFAEANPDFDISGKDTAQKLAILTSIAFDTKINSSQIYAQGIGNINGHEIAYAKEQGWKIKLLAKAKKQGNNLELRVSPTMISKENPLSNINYEINAVNLIEDSSEYPLTFSGAGAGKPAASAVVSDVLNILRTDKYKEQRYFGFEKYNLVDEENISSQFYIRFSAYDKPRILEHITGALGKKRISIWKTDQIGKKEREIVPVIIVTHNTNRKTLDSALNTIDSKKAYVKSVVNVSLNS